MGIGGNSWERWRDKLIISTFDNLLSQPRYVYFSLRPILYNVFLLVFVLIPFIVLYYDTFFFFNMRFIIRNL